MIADFLPDILARFFCFGNYFTEVLPEAITQQLLKFSCAPTFCVINQAYCILVTLKKGLDFFFFHTVSIFLFKEQKYNFFSSFPISLYIYPFKFNYENRQKRLRRVHLANFYNHKTNECAVL